MDEEEKKDETQTERDEEREDGGRRGSHSDGEEKRHYDEMSWLKRKRERERQEVDIKMLQINNNNKFCILSQIYSESSGKVTGSLISSFFLMFWSVLHFLLLLLLF